MQFETKRKIIIIMLLLIEAVIDTSIVQAVEILKTTELYVPYLRDDRNYTDPVASDLVGALIAVTTYRLTL